jgi:hypothetical protein
LEIPGGPLCDRRDAPDEKSLRESARILGLVITSQDFIKFWSEIFVFVLLVLIEIS